MGLRVGRRQGSWKRLWGLRLGAIVAAAALVGGVATVGAGAAGSGAEPRASSDPAACTLGNGVQHVVEITLADAHFFRDNPNVPSDLELMPNLLGFIEQNGTLLSNNHTPLIAHTVDDTLTTLTGLYGDRHGMPIANGYRSFNPDGTTDPAASPTYWTDPILDTAGSPSAGHDTNPSMVYSATPPATTTPAPTPNTTTPAPWVPFTRAGCDVGAVGTTNMELQNTAVDIPKVFGASSPEAQQLSADPNAFKDAETADYVGVAVHCASGSASCATAQGVKFGQGSPSATAVPDVLPGEPGGYAGFQALFGHRYIAPQLGAGTPNVTRHGFQVTNAAGNLVDENGNELDGAFLTAHPGFPGFGSLNASQSLAYVADMQEAGVPVTYADIADLHANQHIAGLAACSGAPSALGSGTACYIAQAQYDNAAFGTFLQRLAADGITSSNTLFIVSSDQGGHEAGANVGRAIQPTPANCDGATVSGTTVTPDVLCTYPAGSLGELAGNLTGLLATERNNTTPFTLESDTAPEFYLTGNPSSGSTSVRTLERDVAALTAANPYTGTTQPIANYLADPTEEAILHMVNADPARMPTLAMFARPDYFLSSGSATCASSCVTQNPGFAWDAGGYAAEINTNFLGLAGPGVAVLGLDGSHPDAGPTSAGADSGQRTVPDSGTTGTWVDETDIRPTLLSLAGLHDSYQSDGRVISEVLTQPGATLGAPSVQAVGQCYKQLNSSVGGFGTSTLQASTRALESTSAGDEVYLDTAQALAQLEGARDTLAGQIKQALGAAEFDSTAVPNAAELLTACTHLITQAGGLAKGVAIALHCAPGAVVAGHATTCTPTVTDLLTTPSTPTGTINFSSSGTGTFSSPGSSCTLAPAATARQASCSVTYTPSAVGSGTHTITASYPGDATHAPSQADTAVRVSASTTPPSPTLTITAPANGSRYTKGQRIASSFTCQDPAGPGISSCLDQNGRQSGSPIDTSTTGSHSFTATATSSDGQTASQTVSYAVTAPRRRPPKPARPRLRALRLTPRAFLAATRGPTISTRRDAGALIRYVDTLAAHSTFTVLRCARSHGRCGKLARVGTFSHRDHARTNTLRFTGRLHGRALRPGRYVLKVTATLAGRRSSAISTSFVILAPPPVCRDPDHDGDCDVPGQI